MPPTTTRLTRWVNLAGRRIGRGYPEGKGFVLELDGGHAVLASRDESLEVLAERGLENGLTEAVSDWGWLAGRTIVAVHPTILAPEHAEKSTLRLGLDDGGVLVFRSAISFAPVVLQA